MFGHVTKHLTAYHHGELPEEKRRRVEIHVAGCSRCRLVLEEVRFAARLAGSLRTTEAPANILEFPASRRVPVRSGFLVWAAAAAVLVLVVSIAVWRNRPELSNWVIDASNAQDSRLRIGEWIETDSASSVTVRESSVGQVRVEPNTKVRLLQSGPSEHRMQLERGTMQAQVWAPPKLFFVETPSALAIDLGCAYTLQVDDEGNSLLHVTSGYVRLEGSGRSSTVPAGWVAKTRRNLGPGTPYLLESSNEMKSAIDAIDFNPDTAAKAAALEVLFKEFGENDLVTMWHLLSRVDLESRKRIYARMTMLWEPPEGVTAEGIANLDTEMMNRWKSLLGLNW